MYYLMKMIQLYSFLDYKKCIGKNKNNYVYNYR